MTAVGWLSTFQRSWSVPHTLSGDECEVGGRERPWPTLKQACYLGSSLSIKNLFVSKCFSRLLPVRTSYRECFGVWHSLVRAL
jgi:hypothetical protein